MVLFCLFSVLGEGNCHIDLQIPWDLFQLGWTPANLFICPLGTLILSTPFAQQLKKLFFNPHLMFIDFKERNIDLLTLICAPIRDGTCNHLVYGTTLQTH